MRQKIITLAVVAVVTAALSSCSAPEVDENEALSVAITGAEEGVPILEYDPTWPKRPLPNDGIFGAILAIDVDNEDHVWVMHWPHYIQGGFSSVTMKPLAFVSEFDANGELLQQWGEAEDPNLPAPGFEWARDRGGAHGIYRDHEGNIWTGSHTPGARYEGAYANLAKFTNDGTLIMQKGAFGQSTGNADTENFGQPTGIVVDEATNEAFVADGYDNRRVIVIDADTMAFKRMWGAYGNEPVDGPLPARTPDSEPSQQFTGVHCIKMSQDGLLYVCDRPNNRVQVFQKDGTFVQEGFVATGFGTVADVAFSAGPEQRFVYVADGSNRKVWILRRDTMETVGSFGNWGNYGGEFAAYMHAIASDSKGNVYVGEFQGGDRVQRFKVVGFEENP